MQLTDLNFFFFRQNLYKKYIGPSLKKVCFPSPFSVVKVRASNSWSVGQSREKKIEKFQYFYV